MYTIYKIENVLNGKLYIGYTSKTVDERYRKHVASARLSNTTTKIARAIRKYGSENFVVSILDTTSDRQECNKLEDDYIINLNTIQEGYNITRGGQGGMLVLYPENPEYETIKAKMSSTHKAKAPFYSELAKENHKNKTIGMYGKQHTEKSKNKIKSAMTGRKHSVEHIIAATEGRNARKSDPNYIDPRKGKKRILSRVICEYCGKDANVSDYKRNHFTANCKKKQ